jgi:hypothetical protein
MSETSPVHEHLHLGRLAASGLGILVALAASAVLTNAFVGSAVASLPPGGAGAVALSPGYVAASCVSTTGKSVSVSWAPVTAATSYAVDESTASASGPYQVVAGDVAATGWTSGPLANGHHWFEVAARVGDGPLGSTSPATQETTIGNSPHPCVRW